MIFDANTTGLGTGVGMAKGYDCSYGCALALVESARSDYQMFRAMLNIDAREMQIQRESAGYVAESQITALAENALTGIWDKIKEFFKKLAEKVKAIWHSFSAKMNTLFMDDKKLVKKYEKELTRKTRVGKLEVKYLDIDKSKTDAISTAIGKEIGISEATDGTGWDESADKRIEYWLRSLIQGTNISADNIVDDLKDYIGYEEEEDTIDKAYGGIRQICNDIKEYSKELHKLEKHVSSFDRSCERVIKAADSKAKEAQKAYNDTDSKLANGAAKQGAKNDLDKANHAYDMCVAYSNAVMPILNFSITATKDCYKYEKAALHKAITANNDKIDEATYLDAVAEAAEQEVDDVISSALSKEELSKINNASLNVMDSDVSDDPNKLTYGPDYYTDNQSYVRTSGSIDTDIASRSEAAFFGQLLY